MGPGSRFIKGTGWGGWEETLSVLFNLQGLGLSIYIIYIIYLCEDLGIEVGS